VGRGSGCGAKRSRSPARDRRGRRRVPHPFRNAAREQIFDAADHELRLERLDENAGAPDRARTRFVHRLERARQQDDGDVRGGGIAFDERRDVVAVALRHADVGEHDVRALALHAIDGVLPAAHRHDLHVFIRERELDHTLNGDAVVGQQERVRHASMIP